jgi:PAS domain S-box-containing protein
MSSHSSQVAGNEQGADSSVDPSGHLPSTDLRLVRFLKRKMRDLPLRRKLRLMVLLVCNGVLLAATIIFVVYDFVSEVAKLRASSASLGKVIGVNSRTSLAFGHQQTGAAIVESLAAHPGVIGAALYQADGALFARTVKRSGNLPAKVLQNIPGETRITFGGFRHVEPISENGRRLGTLIFELDHDALYGRAGGYLAATLLVFVSAALFGRWLTLRLDGIIVEPVVKLASVASEIAEKTDYSLRAQKMGEDEVGKLVDSFNTMLSEIQKRDEAISEAQIELESKVFERTSELHHRIAEGRRNEEIIRENESRYRNLFENNPMPMFVMDLETLAFVAVNNAAMKHYGFSEEEFLRLSLPAITVTDDSQKVVRAFRSNAKSFNAGEWKHLRKTANNIEVELTAHAILFSGKVAKIVLANDVTARNEAQRQLDELHRKLVETSRQAGMAEIATGVLHNVGNVLNSVNVSATVLADSVRGTKATSLKRVAEMLEANKTDLPGFFSAGGKGQMLPAYLSTLSDQISTEQQVRLGELDQLTKNIAHIKDIVAMQQNYAKVTGVLENHSPRVLLDEALQLSSSENKRTGITLEFECPQEMPEVYADRHKVMQILVNLLTNARQAMLDQPEAERLIFISVAREADVVRISIRDNGCGIPQENLTMIFNHGFTTKKDGHGFGLHSAANSAKEMGGALWAESEGAGYGATFHLELPIRQVSQSHITEAAA